MQFGSMALEAIALQMVPGLGLRGVVHLLEHFGNAHEVFAASLDALILKAELRPDLAKEIQRRTTFAAAERELAYCAQHGIRVIASSDPDYPARLLETPDYPAVLYMQGDPSILSQKTLAMVGTRRATPYGEEQCKRLVQELSERVNNLVIVSGLAFGIDAASHRAALACHLPTIAVIANPLPNVTPAFHRSLARTILDLGGAIITEQHSQAKLRGTHYLSRNRIIAGLSAGTIVVESPARGGSLNTANHADSYNRTVMAVPGRPTDATSLGTNQLIRSHKAQLITSGADIVEELMWDFAEEPMRFSPKASSAEDLSSEEARVLGFFPPNDPIEGEALQQLAGIEAGELTALLIGLELSGKIRLLPGNRYMKLCD